MARINLMDVLGDGGERRHRNALRRNRNTEPCHVCGEPLRDSQDHPMVEMLTDLTLLVDEEPREDEDSQGAFPVGPGCWRRLRRLAAEQEWAVSETTALDRALTFAYEHGQLPDSLMDAARAELATLRNQVERDALTGLLNRAGILDRLDTELKRAARSATHPAVLYVDLDHFKQLNDVHGHATGDEALRAAAEAITSKLRATDHAGRLGGEELLVVLSDTEQPEVAAESIREAIHAAHALGVTASIGVASYRLHEPATELVARADQAMYAAKAAGRNRTRVAI